MDRCDDGGLGSPTAQVLWSALYLSGNKMKWLWFIVVELICVAAMVVGWVLLIPFCAFRLWKPARSVHYGTMINVWNLKLVDYIWGNDEDGVTGADFYVKRVPNERWRAYLWSAWRNSSNNLRWIFANPGGPYYSWSNALWRGNIGFKPETGWPVLSADLTKKE